MTYVTIPLALFSPQLPNQGFGFGFGFGFSADPVLAVSFAA